MILVTGASGFVGRALVSALQPTGRGVIAAGRRRSTEVTGEWRRLDLASEDRTQFDELLRDVEAVIHCATYVHQMEGGDRASYFQINDRGTRRLAEAAAAADVRRFVMLSSVKVLGEATQGRPYDDLSEPRPVDDYGRSKLAGEEGLLEISTRTGLEVSILRPPLVYGPGAAGNIARLLRLLSTGIPLPFGSVHNSRSLIGRSNLVDALITAVDAPGAKGGRFLVADSQAVSTTRTLRVLADGLGRRARLLPVPMPVLRAGLRGPLAGFADRLLGDLVVDAAGFAKATGLTPRLDVEASIRSAAVRSGRR